MAGGSLTAQAVADLVGGRLLGDGDLVLRAVGPLDRAGPDALSLAASPRYAAEFRATNAGAVLVPEALAAVPGGPRARIVVAEPYAALAAAIAALYPAPRPTPGVDPTARLGAGAVLGPEVSVGPHAVLERGVRVGPRSRLGPRVTVGEGVTIGDDCLLGPGVVCYPGVRIGSRVVIKAGAVIGGDGFGYRRDARGHVRLPHVGGCVIEDEVEIGSNSCVDRGSIDDTVVGRGTKIDNLVHVGHNCRIGERCLLMAGVGLAGSVRLADDVILAGMAGLADHVEVGAGARVAAKSGVFGDVPAGTTVSGYPARPHRQFLRAQAALYRLAPMAEALERIAAAEARRA